MPVYGSSSLESVESNKNERNQVPINLNDAEFIVAAHKPSQWMTDEGYEVAFAGRSNSGKSTALNSVTRRKGLAKTSKTPGRTQQIVFFQIAPNIRLVDLPGYGYAKVPERVRMHWARVIEQYLETRVSLRGLILTMDIRHPLKPLDVQIINWCHQSAVRVHILLTKSDKLSKSKTAATLASVKNEFNDYKDVTLQAFSGTTGLGVTQAQQIICNLLGQVD
jgi:GTP-binding protein